MKKILTVTLVVMVFSFMASEQVFAQKAGTLMSLFSTKQKLMAGYQVQPIGGKFRLVTHLLQKNVLYNIWSTHSSFEDAEYLHKRFRDDYRPGGTISCLKCVVKVARMVKPGPQSKYTKIITLRLQEVYVKPKP